MSSVLVRALGFWCLKSAFLCVVQPELRLCIYFVPRNFNLICHQPLSFCHSAYLINVVFYDNELPAGNGSGTVISHGFPPEPAVCSGGTSDLAEGGLTWVYLWPLLFIPFVNSLVKCKDCGTGSGLRLLTLGHRDRHLTLCPTLIFSGLQQLTGAFRLRI